VEFVDTYGVGEIGASYISVRRLGGNLKLACLPSKLFIIISWAIPAAEIFDNKEAALNSFRNPQQT
jgi:anti-anti-sigma regulatory factor